MIIIIGCARLPEQNNIINSGAYLVIEAHLIPEGHSILNCLSSLESVRDGLPPFDNEVECRAEIDRSGGSLYVHVWYSGEFKLECSRCLNRFPSTISGDFRVIIEENSTKVGRILDDDSVDFYYNNRNDRVDISPMIYDEILVTIPLMPLCNPQCHGISVKDADIIIDFGQKQEEKKQIDPRWDALRKLKGE